MKHYVSQKRQPLKRTLIYSFMTIVVVMIVTIMSLLVLGFSYDERRGSIAQGGLLQFASVPTGAKVTLDGRQLGSNTNTKATVSANDHSIEYNLERYRPWTKDITITAGQVGWVNYARLVPNNLNVNTVDTLANVHDTLVSPSRSYIAVQPTANSKTFQFVDIRTEEVKKVPVELNPALFTGYDANQSSITMTSWSKNENAVLLRHDKGTTSEWLLLDRDTPASSKNLNREFEMTINNAYFAGNSDQLMFVRADDKVMRASTSSGQVSDPLAVGVASYSVVNSDTISYVTVPSEIGIRTVGYSRLGFDEQQMLRAYIDTTGPILAAQSSYFNRSYVAIIHEGTLTVDTGVFPDGSTSAEFSRLILQDVGNDVTDLSFSRNGRFVLLEYPDKFAVYDIELDKYDETAWAYESDTTGTANWLDDYIFWSDRGGTLRMYDFDGANQQDLMNVTEGFSAALSGGGKYIYGFLQTDAGYELRRVQMIL